MESLLNTRSDHVLKKRRNGSVQSGWGVSIILMLFFLCLSGSVWWMLIEVEIKNIRDKSEFAVTRLLGQFQTGMKGEVNALERMAKRWESGFYKNQDEWEVDAVSYTRDITGLRAIEWVDSADYVRWVAPLKGNEKAINLHLKFEGKRKIALRKANLTGEVTATGAVDLVQGDSGILVFVPLRNKLNQSDGYLLAVYDLKLWFGHHLENIDVRFNYDFSEIDKVSYLHGNIADAYTQPFLVSDEIKNLGIDWSLRVWPSRDYIQSQLTILPYLVLILGIIISIFAGLDRKSVV